MLLSLGLAAPLAAQEQPRMGGVFKAAMIGEPPTLDLHTTTAVLVQHITWHVYETLYTYDKNYNAIPLLVETHAVIDKKPKAMWDKVQQIFYDDVGRIKFGDSFTLEAI